MNESHSLLQLRLSLWSSVVGPKLDYYAIFTFKRQLNMSVKRTPNEEEEVVLLLLLLLLLLSVVKVVL